MSSRGDGERLQDILDAISAIERDTNGLSEQEFFEDDTRLRAVLYSLMIVGEAAANLSPAVKNQSPSTNWSDIKGMRNFIAHEYFRVKMNIVWDVITDELPPLKKTVESIQSTVQSNMDEKRS